MVSSDPCYSAIRFAVNLHEYHNVPITHAYSVAAAQFRALRSEREITTRVALLEAEHYGVPLGPSMTEKMFQEEEKALNSWSKNKQADAMANTARKRWRMIPEEVGEPSAWTKGQEYTRLWQEGIRPTYSPAIASTIITSAGLETAPSQPTVAAPAPAPAAPSSSGGKKTKKYVKASPKLADVLATVPGR